MLSCKYCLFSPRKMKTGLIPLFQTVGLEGSLETQERVKVINILLLHLCAELIQCTDLIQFCS